MIKITPILMAIGIGLVMFYFSAWRTKRMLDRQSTPLEDEELSPLVKRLADVVNLDALDVRVFEIEPINGLAAPDGRIFITRGFLKKYQDGEVSAAEMASVIAHELGHVALGHSQRRMISFTGQNALRVVLGMILGRFIPFVGVYIANFLAGLVGAGLSRRDEFEADAYAAAVLTKAGIGVGPQVTMFEKLQKLAPIQGTPAWLLTHPKTPRRIEAIRKLEAEWSGTPKLPTA